MKKGQAFVQALGSLTARPGAQVFAATVLSIEGSTCTVRALESDVEMDDVRLKATSNDDEQALLIVPKAGSLVLVGMVNDDATDLYLVRCDAIDKLALQIGNVKVFVTGETVSVTRGPVEVTIGEKVELKQGEVKMSLDSKVGIEANGVSLKALFEDLSSLLTTAKVLVTTPNTPAVFDPATLTKVTQLKTKANSLLK